MILKRQGPGTVDNADASPLLMAGGVGILPIQAEVSGGAATFRVLAKVRLEAEWQQIIPPGNAGFLQLIAWAPFLQLEITSGTGNVTLYAGADDLASPTRLMMLRPTPIAAIATSRGTGAANLLTPDPKEVWSDTTVGSDVSIDIDFGREVAIDTVFLGSIYGVAAAGATWSISGGATFDGMQILATTALRALDAAGAMRDPAHAFWTGATCNLRYLRLTLEQPAGSPPLAVGVVMAGTAFCSRGGHEWGAGRKVIDTGTATPLPSGGFATVEGVRKGSYNWTFGDLTPAEMEALYALQLDHGETEPLLVVEDPAQTAGLRNRLHYGKLTSLRPYERRNAVATRWELTVEEWL